MGPLPWGQPPHLGEVARSHRRRAGHAAAPAAARPGSGGGAAIGGAPAATAAPKGGGTSLRHSWWSSKWPPCRPPREAAEVAVATEGRCCFGHGPQRRPRHRRRRRRLRRRRLPRRRVRPAYPTGPCSAVAVAAARAGHSVQGRVGEQRLGEAQALACGLQLIFELLHALVGGLRVVLRTSPCRTQNAPAWTTTSRAPIASRSAMRGGPRSA